MPTRNTKHVGILILHYTNYHNRRPINVIRARAGHHQQTHVHVPHQSIYRGPLDSPPLPLPQPITHTPFHPVSIPQPRTSTRKKEPKMPSAKYNEVYQKIRDMGDKLKAAGKQGPSNDEQLKVRTSLSSIVLV